MKGDFWFNRRNRKRRVKLFNEIYHLVKYKITFLKNQQSINYISSKSSQKTPPLIQ